VIIPNRNRHGFLQRAVSSVLTQSFQDIEVIVVDDASTDLSIETVKEMGDPRVTCVLLPKHVGAQRARRIGIEHARAPWVAFLDSDDFYYPEALSIRLSAAENSGCQVVYTEGVVVGTKTVHSPLCEVNVGSGRIWQQLLERPGPMYQGLLVKYSVARNNIWIDDHIVAFQEWDAVLNLAQKHDFLFVPTPTFVYDRSLDETISKNKLINALGYEQIVNKWMNSILFVHGNIAAYRHFMILKHLFCQARSTKGVVRSYMRGLWHKSISRTRGFSTKS
jgi:glycosyltransferase involved in cell wall biosynthesis